MKPISAASGEAVIKSVANLLHNEPKGRIHLHSKLSSDLLKSSQHLFIY